MSEGFDPDVVMPAARPRPYVGVSGIGHYNQHGEIVDIALREHILGDEYFVMLGVQATSKSQLLNVENKRGRAWHPVGDEIGTAAGNEDSGLTKPFVHCFFQPQELEKGVATVMRRTLHYNQGLQFNMLPWMEQDFRPELERIRSSWPNLQFILQANGPILERYKPQEIARRVSQMALVNYVLIDASHGFGKPLEVKSTRPYVDALYAESSTQGVVVAGGLEAQTMEELFAPLVREFPGLSCDAEGRLRTYNGSYSELDMQKVHDYIHAWRLITPSSTTA